MRKILAVVGLLAIVSCNSNKAVTGTKDIYSLENLSRMSSEDISRNYPQSNMEEGVDEFEEGTETKPYSILFPETEDEVLISTYTCHPSMANNELSGPLVAAFLYRKLAELEHRRLTYRFVFLPETIGSLAYLAIRGDHLKEQMMAGYVVTCVGDDGPFTYKRSRLGTSLGDRAAEHVLDGDG